MTRMLAGLMALAAVAGGQNMSLRPVGTTGAVSGTVLDETGKAVSGAQVAAVRTFPLW